MLPEWPDAWALGRLFADAELAAPGPQGLGADLDAALGVEESDDLLVAEPGGPVLSEALLEPAAHEAVCHPVGRGSAVRSSHVSMVPTDRARAQGFLQEILAKCCQGLRDSVPSGTWRQMRALCP